MPRVSAVAAMAVIVGYAVTGTATAAKPADDLVAEWAQEVLLGTEFGKNERACQRWTRAPSLSVFGASIEQAKVIAAVVEDINSALAKTAIRGINLIEPDTGEADIRVYFSPLAEFPKIAKREKFNYAKGNIGYVYIKWNRKREIFDGTVLLASDRLRGKNLRHFALEEITQSLGPLNDSADLRDSIFYSGPDGGGNAQRLSQRDRELLALLYSDLKPGSNERQVQAAIQKRWFPNLSFEADSKDSVWAQAILLGPEFGGVGRLCSRWVKSPALSVFGGTDEHDELVQKIVFHLNETLAKTPIKRIDLLEANDENATIRVYFIPHTEFQSVAKRHNFNCADNSPGYFYTFWNGRNEIQSACVLLATDRLSGGKLHHYALEEITQSLGLSNDSPEHPDSVFYETRTKFGSATELSPRDKRLLELFYTHIQPGDRRRQVRAAMQQHWGE